MCIVLTYLPFCTCTNQALNLFTSDAPDAPVNVTAEESPDSDPNDNCCILHIDLRPPSNIDVNHIMHYFIQFPSGDRTIPNTGNGPIKVPNCTQDIRLNVSAVNICGTIGASASDIEPKRIMPTPTTSTPTTSAPTTSASTISASTNKNKSTGSGSELSLTLASTTLCAVLLVISVLSS